jgi:hypothetical protein
VATVAVCGEVRMRRALPVPMLPTVERLPRCPVCSEVIGIYEPVIVITSRDHRRTSLALEPGLATSEETVVHHECAAGPPDVTDLG